MSSARAERLVNLVLCLLSTRQYLTAERIRRTVPGYADAASDEAFSRMLERDKAELRELGVPLQTGDAGLDYGDGYRIARRDYELGEIDLEPDEAAAVGLAARVWQAPDLHGAAQGALQKLRAAGVDVETDPPPVEPRVQAPGSALTPLIDAVQAGRAVTFAHRGRPTAEVTTRALEPWGVIARRGRWYVAGHDRDRGATRCFRVSRIVGDVRAVGPSGAVRAPQGTDLRGIVARVAEPPADEHTARLWLADGHAQGLRRHASLLARRTLDGVAGDLVALPVPPLDAAARWIAGYGPDAVVLKPAELADEVRSRLLAAAGENPAGPNPAEQAPTRSG